MPSLKDLRVRIRSVRSTQKITAAMKMVAASRLRRAQEQAEAARPYAQRMERVLASLAARMAGLPNAPPLLVGTGRDDTHLIVVATSDRGLAGGFNATILREARRRIRELEAAGKRVKILTIGRKGRDGLRRDYGRLIHDSLTEIGRRRLSFDEARDIAERILVLFRAGAFDVVHDRLQPLPLGDHPDRHGPAADPVSAAGRDRNRSGRGGGRRRLRVRAVGGGDPRRILAAATSRCRSTPRLLENAASEQGARMTAMDNATRNAGEMIDRLTINYNRTRQAVITKELIEIISGAEALCDEFDPSSRRKPATA